MTYAELEALERLKHAAIVVADILDAGERDPSWQELENAAIAYGREVRNTSAVAGAEQNCRSSKLASPATFLKGEPR